MTSTIPAPPSRSIAVPAEFFGALRDAAQQRADAVESARDAGYAAGVALFEQFGAWLAGRGFGAPESIPHDEFGAQLGQFLASSGWGGVETNALSDAVMALDTTDWAEAEGKQDADGPSCHVGTGLLAGFLGRVADAPLAVLEVECRSTGASRCRFVIGSVDVLQYVHEAMERGVPYDLAASSAASD